jgi:quercetin dioxygenase-like cupin family protein
MVMKNKSLNRKTLRVSALTAMIIFVAMGPLAAPVKATPPSGLTSAQIGSGDLPEPVRVMMEDARTGHAPELDAARVVVSEIQLQPGGETGWHGHGGPVWAVITSGTVHLYSGEDPECQPEVFSQGTVFLDPGDHIHNARNEGDEVVTVYTTFMLPEDGEQRIDKDDPGTCDF